MAVVLTAKQIADMLGYRQSRRIPELYRTGHFPAPIDPGLPTASWRWSPAVIDRYVAGEWSAAA